MTLPALLMVCVLAAPAEGPYDHLVERYASRYGVPTELVLVLIWNESRFSARAVSPAAAYGLMQVKLSTGRRVLPSLVRGRRDLLDPETNIHAGIRYLAWLRDRRARLGLSDWLAILAAYNAGPGAVRRSLRRRGRLPRKAAGYARLADRELYLQFGLSLAELPLDREP